MELTTLALILVSALLLAVLGLWRNERARRAEAERVAREKERFISSKQEELQASFDAQSRALFDSMVEGVLLVDGSGRIRMANQALQRLFGVSTGLTDRNILEAFRLPELEDLSYRLRQGGGSGTLELHLQQPEPRFIRVNAAAIAGSGHGVQGVIFVFHDMTRLRELEATRRDFVANVSHELRTPLSMIKGFTETLLDGAKDDPAVSEKFLRTIEKHANRLMFLIEDLLTLSRLESGQDAMNCQWTELRPVVERVFEDMADRAREKQVRLMNEISPQIQVWADADRLEQVFFNLVENAVKYGCADGAVTVGAVMKPGGVEVTVTDDGPGIPDEALGRVFERFYRVDRARSREAGGTGLGLSIVKHIVQAHGGEADVRSELGKGATFFFNLPKAKTEPTAASPLHPPQGTPFSAP